MEINKKVLLLAIYKEDKMSFKEVILMLENTKVFTIKEGKKLLKELKRDNFLSENGLTLKGEMMAKEIEKEFKI